MLFRSLLNNEYVNFIDIAYFSWIYKSTCIEKCILAPFDSDSTSISLCTLIRASPINLYLPVLFLKKVISRFNLLRHDLSLRQLSILPTTISKHGREHREH